MDPWSVSMGGMLALIQLFFTLVIGAYFWTQLRTQQSSRAAVERESRKEQEKLRHLRAVGLSEPLAEKTRPADFTEIVGQEDGIRALRAAICGPNPQHVIIYGPPGVGKTAAARLVLEEAKKDPLSPFGPEAKFIEVDGATTRFDERGIADPLIGSVHDPIYQGAGPMGMAGIPQPKPGAVTKAHGGILFVDEIGELHPIQINKLLKVLEDRKVMLESAYYSSEDSNIPPHIHDIFQQGLPADFRLVGATTRMPQEIPPAIRSRCLEIFFRPLLPEDIKTVARRAAAKVGYQISEAALDVLAKYATNGREAVNMVQIAAGVVITEGRQEIIARDMEWVVNSGQYSPRPEKKVPDHPEVGVVNGLAVYGPNLGLLLEIEVSVIPVARGRGGVIVTGVVEEEEVTNTEGRLARSKSMVKSSVENVLTVLRRCLDVDPRDYDIHVNFPGGIPIDGPSAGISIATAVYSAIKGLPVDNRVAMTGEVSIRGTVRPVGGIVPKVEAARQAGARIVIIPSENWQEVFAGYSDLTVLPVRSLQEVIALALLWPMRTGHLPKLVPVAKKQPLQEGG